MFDFAYSFNISANIFLRNTELDVLIFQKVLLKPKLENKTNRHRQSSM